MLCSHLPARLMSGTRATSPTWRQSLPSSTSRCPLSHSCLSCQSLHFLLLTLCKIFFATSPFGPMLPSPFPFLIGTVTIACIALGTAYDPIVFLLLHPRSCPVTCQSISSNDLVWSAFLPCHPTAICSCPTAVCEAVASHGVLLAVSKC